MIPNFLIFNSTSHKESLFFFLQKQRHIQTNLTKLHRSVRLLALLKILKQERACLLVSVVDLKTLVKHSFVLATSALQLLLLLLHDGSSTGLGGRGGGLAASSTHASNSGSNSLVRNGGTSTESHTLSNGGSNSREHASRFLGCRWGGCGSRRSCGRGSATGGCATAASAGARTSSACSL
jgi:hypothetical protein